MRAHRVGRGGNGCVEVVVYRNMADGTAVLTVFPVNLPM